MDPYASGIFKENPFGIKRKIQCSVVAVLKARAKGRGLNLIQPISRALKKYDIHELILTDEKESKPGKTVNQIAYIAFVEVLQGGIIVVGDEVYWMKQLIGIVAGFDDTHMPNHQNIVLFSPKIITGKELNMNIEDPIFIKTREGND